MNHPLDALFDQFLKERRYLKNVTEATLVWYRMAFSNYTSFVADDHPPPPTNASLQGFVMDTNGWPERERQHQHQHHHDRAGDTAVPGVNRFNGMAAAIAW